MPMPSVRICLLCEDVRPETGGKLSLLGLFGASPHVAVRLADVNAPIARLMFVFITELCEANEEVFIGGRLTDDAGNEVVALPPHATIRTRLERGKALNAAIGLGNLTLRAGSYRFELLVGGRPHYDAQFRIEQGAPADFR